MACQEFVEDTCNYMACTCMYMACTIMNVIILYHQVSEECCGLCSVVFWRLKDIVRNALPVLGTIMFYMGSIWLDFLRLGAHFACFGTYSLCRLDGKYVISIMFHLLRVLFMGLLMVFCILFYNRVVLRCATVRYGILIIMATSVCIWFDSTIHDSIELLDDDDIAHNICNNVTLSVHDMRCLHENTTLYTHTKAVAPYIYPLMIEFLLLSEEIIGHLLYEAVDLQMFMWLQIQQIQQDPSVNQSESATDPEISLGQSESGTDLELHLDQSESVTDPEISLDQSESVTDRDVHDDNILPVHVVQKSDGVSIQQRLQVLPQNDGDLLDNTHLIVTQEHDQMTVEDGETSHVTEEINNHMTSSSEHVTSGENVINNDHVTNNEHSLRNQLTNSNQSNTICDHVTSLLNQVECCVQFHGNERPEEHEESATNDIAVIAHHVDTDNNCTCIKPSLLCVAASRLVCVITSVLFNVGFTLNTFLVQFVSSDFTHKELFYNYVWLFAFIYYCTIVVVCFLAYYSSAEFQSRFREYSGFEMIVVKTMMGMLMYGMFGLIAAIACLFHTNNEAFITKPELLFILLIQILIIDFLQTCLMLHASRLNPYKTGPERNQSTQTYRSTRHRNQPAASISEQGTLLETSQHTGPVNIQRGSLATNQDTETVEIGSINSHGECADISQPADTPVTETARVYKQKRDIFYNAILFLALSNFTAWFTTNFNVFFDANHGFWFGVEDFYYSQEIWSHIIHILKPFILFYRFNCSILFMQIFLQRKT